MEQKKNKKKNGDLHNNYSGMMTRIKPTGSAKNPLTHPPFSSAMDSPNNAPIILNVFRNFF